MYSALPKRTVAFLVLWAGIVSCTSSYHQNNSTLPVIDLGYVKQQATVYNETYDWYVFKNIRFAAPPLGNLRFRKTQPPLPQKGIQNGSVSSIYSTSCHQTIPPFLIPELNFTVSYGVEDCLFLDVYVPRSIKPTDSVPVLTWFYGGGYTVGGKDLYQDPAGLIKSAATPVIYVSPNYRLGSFGWLSDPEEDIDANAGLYDARAAMDWVHEYIPKFGGDNKKITVIGESAGAGVLLHTITAYGGQHSPPPFQQAIVQSPGFEPDKVDFPVHASTYKLFQSAANCTSLKCLRQAPTAALLSANEAVILKQDQTDFGSFGPVVDGDYVPDIPMKLIAEGKFHQLESIISANNGFEAGYFYPSPAAVTNTTFNKNLGNWFPNASESIIRTINELYPKGNNSEEEWLRNIDFFSDVVFTCNGQAIAQALKKKAYRYVFNIPPAFHADDVPYTFYNGPGWNSLVKSDWAAVVLQKWVTDYTIHGDPGCGGTSPCFLKYGSGSNALSLNLTDVKRIKDPWSDEKCSFLQHVAFKNY